MGAELELSKAVNGNNAPDGAEGNTMRNRTPTMLVALSVLVLLVVGMTACASVKAQCPNLTGIQLTACEAAAIRDAIELQQPKAFAALDAIKLVVTADVADRITQAEALWPSAKASIDSAVAGLQAGAAGDYSKAIAEAVAWYVNTSALIIQGGGKALPGLPGTRTVNALKS